MKRRKNLKRGVLAGSVLLASSLLSGCVRPAPAVYGPPPVDPDDPSFHAEENIPAPVYGPGPDIDVSYDPENNVPEDVYGPPPFEEIEDEEPPAEEGTEVQP